MTAPGGVTAENPHAGQGSVLLDIGGDIGALVVEMPPGMDGVEVEARRVGLTTVHVHHPHVAVVDRATPSGHQPSLVFPALLEGTYRLCRKSSDAAHMTAVVRGGEVTITTWVS